MTDGLRILTFEGTTADALYDMTVEITEGTTLVLKQARVEQTYTGVANRPRTINVSIASTVSEYFVVDNDKGYNFLKIGLDYNPIGTDPNYTNVSITYPDIAYKVSGRIPTSCRVTLYDTTHTRLTGLVYYFFQFVVVPKGV